MIVKNLRKLALPMIPAISIIIIWEFMVRIGYMDPTLFSSPFGIWRAIMDSLFGDVSSSYELIPNIVATLKRLFWGFLIGSFSGIFMGLVMGNVRFIRKIIEPIVTFIMPIPGIAMAPVFMVVMGFGDKTIITVGAVAMFFPVILNTMAGVRSVDKNLENAASIMGVSKLGMYLRVHLPWTIEDEITG